MKSAIKYELKYQENLKKLYQKKLKNLPIGTLSVNQRHDKKYYFNNISGVRTYLGTAGNETVQLLQQRRYLEESIRQIDINIAAMKSLLSVYGNFDPVTISEKLPKAYQNLPDTCFELVDRKNLTKWEKTPYKKYDGFPEGLTQKTLRGDFVRSKSEVIIANALFTNKVPYHYEEVVKIGEKLFAPDFKIAVPGTGKFKLWEHLGKISDEDYLAKNMYKMQYYLSQGLRMWEDIIFTFDDLYGNIDAVQIDNIIKTFCL